MAKMRPRSAPAESPEEYLSRFPSEVCKTARELRMLIRECIPGAVERVNPGWRLIAYRVPDGTKSWYCCYLDPTEDSVELGFEYGRLLSDPSQVLSGSGSQVRKIAVRAGSKIRKQIVRQLLREAALITLEGRQWNR